MLGDLDGKMRTIASTVGKENTCSLVIDNAVVVYAGPDAVDITTTLVNRYNAAHPPK
jgi:Skp family chaperone for outer membrane proteins